MSRNTCSRYLSLQRERRDLETLEREIWSEYRDVKDGEQVDNTRVLQLLRRKIYGEGYDALEGHYAKLQRLDLVRETLAQIHTIAEEDCLDVKRAVKSIQSSRGRVSKHPRLCLVSLTIQKRGFLTWTQRKSGR